FWAVGTIAVALAAWAASIAGIADAWRWIFAATALPALIGIWLRFWVPESPLYLLKEGRADDAKRVLNQMLRTNGKAELSSDSAITLPPAATSSGLLAPDLRRRTLLILGIWFLVSVSYYGVFTW
ncbi:MFS transporter, partial [Cupriavidus sp. 2MCAB6]